jgi:hypothetical protein
MTMQVKWLLVAAGVVLAGAALARDSASDEREIRNVEALICAAFEQGDGSVLEKNLDERFTLTSSHGEVTNRKQNIAEVTSREPHYEVFRNHDQDVRLYGDAAIVTGITTIRASVDSKPFAADFQFTDTYVYREGRWLLAASHASKLVK